MIFVGPREKEPGTYGFGEKLMDGMKITINLLTVRFDSCGKLPSLVRHNGVRLNTGKNPALGGTTLDLRLENVQVNSTDQEWYECIDLWCDSASHNSR